MPTELPPYVLFAFPGADNELATKRDKLFRTVVGLIGDACSHHPALNRARLEEVARLAIWQMAFTPGSLGKHHCWLGGLLDHTGEVLGSAIDLLRLHPETTPGQLSWVRLVAAMAAIYHDLGKTATYEVLGYNFRGSPINSIRDIPITCGPTELHRTHGHLSLSYAMWEAESAPGQLSVEVGHAILAHHQLREWGSPVSPQSPAAWAVHLADMASVNISEQAYKQRDAKHA